MKLSALFRAPTRSLTIVREVATETAPVIVFVHGLNGAPRKTWAKMIAACEADASLNGYELACFSYPTRQVHWNLFGRMIPIQEIAQGLSTELRNRYGQNENITLVGYSLGGVVIRQYILEELAGGRRPLATRALFYAVPHLGATLAQIGALFSFKHHQLLQLSPDENLLTHLNDEWVRLKADQRVEIGNVIAGSDGVVSPVSATAGGNLGQADVLVWNGHVNIVQPQDHRDTRYLVLKNFISRVPEGRAADPLFDIYTNLDEPYYLTREIDRSIETSSAATHVWISGPSGLGKTTALRRWALRKGAKLLHLSLGSYADQSPLALMRAICLEVCEAAQAEPPAGDCDLAVIAKKLRQCVAQLSDKTSLLLLVEEIRIAPGHSYSQFLRSILDLLEALQAIDAKSERLTLSFSSLHNPAVDLLPGMAKLRERVRFLAIEPWQRSDAHRLVELLAAASSSHLTLEERGHLVAASKGSPRFIKMVFRHLRDQGRGANFAAVVQTVQEEIV